MSFLSSQDILDYVTAPEIVATEAPKAFRLTFGRPKPPIIAICHLSWNWVWQRPQQLLSRLAENHSVLFVETHCTHTHQSFTRTRAALDHPTVTILEIHLPEHRWHDGSFIDAERRRILQQLLAGEFAGAYDDAILWFNDPLAVTAYAGQLGERMIVYDCIVELTQFHGAPACSISGNTKSPPRGSNFPLHVTFAMKRTTQEI